MEIGNGTLATGGAASALAGTGAFIAGATSSGGVSASGVALGTLGLAGVAAGGYAGYKAYQGYTGGDKTNLGAAEGENGLITDGKGDGTHGSTPVNGSSVDETDKQARLAAQAQKDKEKLAGDNGKKTVAKGANGEVHTTVEELPNEPEAQRPVRLNLSVNPDGTVQAKIHAQPDTAKPEPQVEKAQTAPVQHENDVKIPTQTAHEAFHVMK